MRIGTRDKQERARRKTARRRGGQEPKPAPGCAAQPPARSEARPQGRERDAGGPQDRALYVCRCGSAFQAVVTASVRCPHCGDPQAW